VPMTAKRPSGLLEKISQMPPPGYGQELCSGIFRRRASP
jgi:hypothetical protein